MADPPPVPNIANINAAVAGMNAKANNIAQHIQAFNTHQQQFTAEMSLCANYDTTQIRNQLATINRSIADMTAMTSAQ